ncbi:hypothetical protein SAMN05421579_10153 [Xenorhabdus japonica]|uniref:Uncharacterized protein n=1 Tax=Xenorhabdus japonica TaxID=53341 RepID=A0A1I4Y7R0_9GAMM|nr:hypothetical protein SAMN05421579_10153 [Xenorhabdus japonica]
MIAHKPIQCVIGMNDLQVVNSISHKLNFFLVRSKGYLEQKTYPIR